MFYARAIKKMNYEITSDMIFAAQHASGASYFFYRSFHFIVAIFIFMFVAAIAWTFLLVNLLDKEELIEHNSFWGLLLNPVAHVGKLGVGAILSMVFSDKLGSYSAAGKAVILVFFIKVFTIFLLVVAIVYIAISPWLAASSYYNSKVNRGYDGEDFALLREVYSSEKDRINTAPQMDILMEVSQVNPRYTNYVVHDTEGRGSEISMLRGVSIEGVLRNNFSKPLSYIELDCSISAKTKTEEYTWKFQYPIIFHGIESVFTEKQDQRHFFDIPTDYRFSQDASLDKPTVTVDCVAVSSYSKDSTLQSKDGFDIQLHSDSLTIYNNSDESIGAFELVCIYTATNLSIKSFYYRVGAINDLLLPGMRKAYSEEELHALQQFDAANSKLGNTLAFSDVSECAVKHVYRTLPST